MTQSFVAYILERCHEAAGPRLNELGGTDSLGINDVSAMFPTLFPIKITQRDTEDARKSNIREALKFSLWQLYNEAIIAYLIELDRITIIACRGVVERALRVAYQDKTGNVANDKWSLGPLINNCKRNKISEKIIELACAIKNEGDNLAHAKYEIEKHWNGVVMKKNPKSPFLSRVHCGSCTVSSPSMVHYMTGDAKTSLVLTRDLLKLIFSS
jgi:hypothetical protein